MGEGPYWERLLKDKTKQHWLKVDFQKWKDEDDSDEEAGGGDLEEWEELEPPTWMISTMIPMMRISLIWSREETWKESIPRYLTLSILLICGIYFKHFR